MVTPTTSTRTAIPQTAVSVKVKDYERYDGSGGKREVEYYDQPNYQDTTGAPRTEYTWVDTRPVNPRTQKERRNLPTFKSAVPEGYESNLAEQEAMLQEYQSQIQAQQLAPASQAQLRSGASGMAGYAQRQAEAQQFEQAKQEALGQVYSQGEQIDKAQQELAEFQRQERDVYSQAEAEIRAQELMEKQFEEIDLPQGNVVQTFTAPQGEKMIFADDGRTIAGVESAAFGQSLALPQYQAKVEEWNARVAEQEAQKAIDLSFFGKVTGQQPVSTRQGIVFKPMAIAGTTLMPPTKIEQPTRTTPWAPLPVMVYKENKPSIQATINYITRPDVVAGAYVSAGKGVAKFISKDIPLAAKETGRFVIEKSIWPTSASLVGNVYGEAPKEMKLDLTTNTATLEPGKRGYSYIEPTPLSPSTYNVLGVASGFAGAPAVIGAGLFFAGGIKQRQAEVEALKIKELTWKDYAVEGAKAGAMSLTFGYGITKLGAMGIGKGATGLTGFALRGAKTTVQSYFIGGLAGETYKIGSLAKQGYWKQAALPATSLGAGIVGASVYPGYKYATQKVNLKVGKTPAPKVIGGQVIGQSTTKGGVTKALVKFKVQQPGQKYVTVPRYQTWLYKKPTTLATGQVVMAPKTVSIFGKKVAITDVFSPKYEGGLIKYQVKYAPLTPEVITTKVKYTTSYGRGIAKKVRPINLKYGDIKISAGKKVYKTSIWLESNRLGAQQVKVAKVSGRNFIVTEKKWNALPTKYKTLVGKAVQQQRVLEFGKGVRELKGKELVSYLQKSGKQVSIIPEVKVAQAYKYQKGKPVELVRDIKPKGIYIDVKGKAATINYQTKPQVTLNLKNIKPLPSKTITTRMASVTEPRAIVLIEEPGKPTRGFYKAVSAVGKTKPVLIDERIIQIGKQGSQPFAILKDVKRIKTTGSKSSPAYIQSLYDVPKATKPGKYTQPKVFKDTFQIQVDEKIPASEYGFGKSKYAKGFLDVDAVANIEQVGLAGALSMSAKVTPIPTIAKPVGAQLFVYSPKLEVKPVQVIKPLTKETTIQKSLQIVKPILKTETVVKPITKTYTEVAIKSIQKTIPAVKPVVKPIVKPILKPIVKPATPAPTTPRPSTPSIPKTPFGFGIPKKPTKAGAKPKAKGTGVIPYGRRKGKYMALGGPTTLEKAKFKAKKFLLTTLGASAQIKTTRGELLPIAEENRLFRPGSKGKDIFTLVQRRSKRLKSKYETSEIVGIRRGMFFK